jgi:hypothetical protein
MNPQALVQLILGLEPEAVALITLLVKHLQKNKTAAPTTAPPPATAPHSLASTSLDPSAPTPEP